ncbi:DUF4190 domain-containing protein [Kutzneria sp. 744]|uniref:DUF4190 domain-containing protein n=1 Tax=Kutzneria sp. (strain 744) TaxID=345341 RepID=UPI0003EED995|nr:DUF4190 domain-containing protein [Kutzneria sp. 744]EWM14427.1 integral membrane protein [Kutzneria sp. 744]
MSTEPEQPAYQNYPAMPPAQASPWSQATPPGAHGLPYGTQPPHGSQPVPYGSQPGYYPPPGYRPGVNGFAVASLVLGILGPVGGLVLGLVFGIIALVDIRRTGQRGKGLAIAGISVSGVWILLVGAFLVVGLFAAATDPDRASSSSYDIKPGQCFDRPTTSKGATVTVRDCATPHDAEAFAVEPVPGSAYPGLTVVESLGSRKCPDDSDRFLTPGLNYPDFAVHYLYPQESSWSRGDRSVICFFRRADGFPFTGHVKDTGLPYTADQKRYLDAVAPYDKIVDEEYDTATWSEEREVVGRSVAVLQKEIEVLKAGPWPTNAQSAIGDLVTAKQLELADRQRAAAATDSDSMDDALDDALDHDGSEVDLTIRTALHLPAR